MIRRPPETHHNTIIVLVCPAGLMERIRFLRPLWDFQPNGILASASAQQIFTHPLRVRVTACTRIKVTLTGRSIVNLSSSQGASLT